MLLGNPARNGIPKDRLLAIVGPDRVRQAESTDTVLENTPQMVIEPGTEEELSAVLRCADDAGLSVLPRGGGTKIGWGNPPTRADLVLSTARLSNVREHSWADLTVIVEAGCTIRHLQECLEKHGQRLAIDALWPDRATVGGVLSTNDTGSWRMRFGGLRDLIVGVTLALPDGTLANSGGKVVKNVAGYDLPKLATGSLGTLGVITKAVFRLHPLPRNRRTLSIFPATVPAAEEFMLAILNSKIAAVGLQAQLSSDSPPVVHLLFEGTEAGLSAIEHQVRKLTSSEIRESSFDVWKGRHALWSLSETAAMAKFSVLPGKIGSAIELVTRFAADGAIRWSAIAQGTGIGWLRLDGPADKLRESLERLRTEIERDDGSLVVLHQPSQMKRFDAWGSVGTSQSLMQTLKRQFDQNWTLNPGRFVGGI